MPVVALTESTGPKRQLLDAAFSLIGEQGFEVSLREITKRAGANVASVNYHFGSKGGLVDAVVMELCRPINAERLERLAILQERGEPTVNELLRAFHEPLITKFSVSALREQLFVKLMGRLVGERPYHFPPEVMTQFRQVAKGFVPAFQNAVPGLSRKDVFWNIHFSFGVVAHSFTHGELLTEISAGVVKKEHVQELMDRMIKFCEAGFLAKAPKGGAQ